jgi:hypothetical protein
MRPSRQARTSTPRSSGGMQESRTKPAWRDSSCSTDRTSTLSSTATGRRRCSHLIRISAARGSVTAFSRKPRSISASLTRTPRTRTGARGWEVPAANRRYGEAFGAYTPEDIQSQFALNQAAAAARAAIAGGESGRPPSCSFRRGRRSSRCARRRRRQARRRVRRRLRRPSFYGGQVDGLLRESRAVVLALNSFVPRAASGAISRSAGHPRPLLMSINDVWSSPRRGRRRFRPRLRRRRGC